MIVICVAETKTYFISGRATPLDDERKYTTRGIGVRKHIPGLPMSAAAAGHLDHNHEHMIPISSPTGPLAPSPGILY